MNLIDRREEEERISREFASYFQLFLTFSSHDKMKVSLEMFCSKHFILLVEVGPVE